MSDSVPLVAYDSQWALRYQEEKERILEVIGDKVVAIEHFGSTAVPGLEAKPIIDVLIAIRHLDDAKECIEPLGRLGYEYRPLEELITPESRYFRKGPPGANSHHIRMVEAGNTLWNQYLLFRDYLRSHPEEAGRYCELKKELHLKYGKRLPTDAKKSHVDSVLIKARAEKGLC